MQPERWEQIEALLDVVLDKSPEARMDYLRQACADDPALFDEVVALLSQEDQSSDLLDQSPEQLFDTLLAGLQQRIGAAWSEAETTATGQTLGPYRLLDEIGRGGMGVVYRAERADGQFTQEVAIKMVKRGMDTDALLRRFRHERQILASLDHPNIARLLDGGATDDGRPYLVMEYVDGTPIDAYCEAQQLDIPARLRLFMQAVSAVQYAHRNLVIHRDLKPSNMLVVPAPEGTNRAARVKLLDFGIAKLLDDTAGADAPLTRTGVRVLTPQYASPEQLSGEQLTTATDVYALGIVLYQLLTGQHPFPRSSEMTIRRTPVRPSTAVRTAASTETLDNTSTFTSGGTLYRQLRGDLDNIILKALREEPDQRYVSAEQLLQDIQRHLSGQTVLARPATLGYRTQKFIQRNRPLVVAAAVIVVLLISYVVTLNTQATRIAQERDRAQAEAAKATRVTAFLTDLFAAADPLAPGSVRVDTMRVPDFLVNRTAAIADLADQPEAQAQVQSAMGKMFIEMGRLQASIPLLEAALAQQEATLPADHTDLYETRQRLAEAYFLRGRYDDARPLLETNLMNQTARYGRMNLPVARSLNMLGDMFRTQGMPEKAEPYLQEALAIRQELLGVAQPVGQSLNNLALAYHSQARYAEAEELLRESIRIKTEVLGPDHPRVGVVTSNLGQALHAQRRFAEAIPVFEASIAIMEPQLGPDNWRVNAIKHSLSRVLIDQGGNAEAERILRDAIPRLAVALGPDHSRTISPSIDLARTLTAQGRASEAEQMLRQVVDQCARVFGAQHYRTGAARSYLGASLVAQQRYAEAEPHVVEGYDIIAAMRGPASRTTQRALDEVVSLYRAWGKPDQAAPYEALLP